MTFSFYIFNILAFIIIGIYITYFYFFLLLKVFVGIMKSFLVIKIIFYYSEIVNQITMS